MDFFEALQAMMNEVDDFFTQVAKDVDYVVTSLVEAAEVFSAQVQTAIDADLDELEQNLTTFFDPIREAYLGFEINLQETAQPFTSTVEPMLNNHPVCVGCRNYHGQTYGDSMLVCGLHPYGWEGDKCPDWESSWKRPDSGSTL
jgi:hypothetical protein